MEENTTDFGGELKSLAEIADLIEKNNLLKDEDIQIKISLEKPKYNKILKHFREIDWNSEKFFISFGKVSFKFVLKR